MPVLAAVSLLATHGEFTPRTLTMMGGPIDARKSPTAVNNLAMNKSFEWFENNVIYRVPDNFAGAGRRVYPGFLQHTGFVAMNPDRHMTAHYDYFKDLIRGDGDSTEQHRQFYDEYNAVLDMPAEYYLETIKTVFQDFALVNRTWEVDGTLVRPEDITTSALLTVEGELDDISGSGQTKAAHGLCTGIPKERQFHYDVEGAGHYGIFSGRRWRDMAYPVVRDFILRYNPVTVTPDAAAKPAPLALVEASPPAMAAPMQGSAQAAVAAPKRPPSRAPRKPVELAVVQAAPAPVAKAVRKAAAKPAVTAAAAPVASAVAEAVDAVAATPVAVPAVTSDTTPAATPAVVVAKPAAASKKPAAAASKPAPARRSMAKPRRG